MRIPRWLAMIATVLVVGVAVGFVAATLADRWEESRDALRDARPAWLALAALGAAAGMTWIAWTWRHAARLTGGDMTSGQSVRWYVVGELGKYVPGSVWPVVGRAELARRAGADRRIAYSGVALSLVAVYAANAVVVAALRVWPLAAAVVAVALLVPPARRYALLVIRYLPAWVLIATATWCVARAFGPAAWTDVAPAAVFSWLVGFLVIPAPGGVGVREAAFVAAVGLPAGVAATIAVVARLVFVGVDAALAATAAAWEVARR